MAKPYRAESNFQDLSLFMPTYSYNLNMMHKSRRQGDARNDAVVLAHASKPILSEVVYEREEVGL